MRRISQHLVTAVWWPAPSQAPSQAPHVSLPLFLPLFLDTAGLWPEHHTPASPLACSAHPSGGRALAECGQASSTSLVLSPLRAGGPHLPHSPSVGRKWDGPPETILGSDCFSSAQSPGCVHLVLLMSRRQWGPQRHHEPEPGCSRCGGRDAGAEHQLPVLASVSYLHDRANDTHLAAKLGGFSQSRAWFTMMTT